MATISSPDGTVCWKKQTKKHWNVVTYYTYSYSLYENNDKMIKKIIVQVLSSQNSKG